MLTYAYECDKCGEFEYEQRITEPKLTQCPDCGSSVQRLISGGAGFMMKGGGSSFGGECQSCSHTAGSSHCGGCGK